MAEQTVSVLKPDAISGKYQGTTGPVKSVAQLKCISLGEKCPIRKALELRARYLQTLSDLNKCVKENDLKMRMADFVREIAQSAPKASDGKITENDVWKRMRPAQPTGSDCSAYKDSALYSDIATINDKIKKCKEASEAGAKELIAFIKSDNFQNHLIKAHARKDSSDADIDFLSAEKVFEFYAIAPEKKAKIRTIDHIAALLTEELSATQPGMKFLEELIDEKLLTKMVAFSDVWGYTKKIVSAGRASDYCLEATSKLLYNVAPVICGKIQKLIFDMGKATVLDIMKDPDLKRVFDFLDKKFDIDISGWLKNRADLFGSKGTDAITKINSGKKWDDVLHLWTTDIDSIKEDKKIQETQKKFDKATNTLNGAWLSITLDVIAFYIALSKITDDFKKAKIKDWFGALGSLSGMAKTFADTYSASLRVQSGNALTAESAEQFVTKASQAAKWAKGFGVASGIFTAIVGTMDVIKGVQRKDWEVFTLNLIGVGMAGAGIYCGIIGASMASGILAVAGLALAIIMALVLDPPVLDYLEDQYWSKNWKEKSKKIKLENTIIEFYKTMFKIEVRYVKTDEYDKSQSYIEIESSALADPSPVYVEIINENKNQTIGKKTIYPGSTTVNGKGQIRKDSVSWAQGWPFYSKRINILKFWEIWNGIQSSSTEKYSILVGVDPDGKSSLPIQNMALNDEATGVIFDFYQEPILRDALTGMESFFENQTTIGLTIYLQYKPSNVVKVNVFTQYASGCTFTIASIRHRSFSSNEVMCELKDCKISGNCTSLYVPVSPPPPNDYYEVSFEISLFSNGNKVKSIETPVVRFASEEYMRKERGE